MSIEFLGHKKSLLQFILSHVEREVSPESSDFTDLFCGTSAVSVAFKKRGYKVTANDRLVWCSVSAEAMLLNDGEPGFEGVAQLVERRRDHLIRVNPVRRRACAFGLITAEKGVYLP